MMFDMFLKVGKYLGQVVKMMIGVLDYDNYVEYMCIMYLDQMLMIYEEFFCEWQDVCYGGKGGVCCC